MFTTGFWTAIPPKELAAFFQPWHFEIEIPAADVPDDPTDGVDDDDPPIEPVPAEGTPEDGVTPALFAEDLDPESEVRP